MTDDLAAASARQLEAWAFGRQGSAADERRAEEALRELARRAEGAKAELARTELVRADLARADDRAEAAAPSAHDDDATLAGTPHRRRMLATGLAGLTAASLALVTIGGMLAQPDPDPLAVFERPGTPADRAWEAQLTRDYVADITQGPRSLDLGDGITAIVLRAAAVVDGRSTAYDPYCLFTTERTGDSGIDADSLRAVGGSCILPERFATDGITLPLRPTAGGDGFDTVIWGPTGAPRLERNAALESIEGIRSVLDWMVYPVFASSGDPLATVDEPNRLLLGPTIVPLNADDSAVSGTSSIIVSAYLLAGESPDAGPVFCARATVAITGDTTTCAALSIVRRQGLDFTVTTTDGAWEVQLGPDGDARTDRIIAAE